MIDSKIGVTSRIKLDEILRSVSRLRPIPSNATRILKALDDPLATAGYVAELVALDQAITAYLLRVANSVSQGYLVSCSSVKDAIIRLGFKQVRSLVMSTVAAGPLSARLSGYRAGAKGLWYHSVATACASHWLATMIHYPDPEKAYVAGLLHDIGKLVLDQYVLADYNQIMFIMQSRQVPMWQVEEELFGIDHAGVGGLASKHWQFPNELVEAIQNHHNPSLELPDQRLASIVNLANALIPENNGQMSVLEGRVIHLTALEILKISPDSTESIREKLGEALFTYQDRQLTP
jgi:putative nucleotidyltransferase with HDIG domain